MSKLLKNKREYWITNISTNRDISISDLKLTVRKGTTINLLDSKHYNYTYEQLEESRLTGSIKSRDKFIKVRDFAPRLPVNPGLQIARVPRIIQQLRAPAVKVEQKQYEDLGDFAQERLSEEQRAAIEADMVFDDNVPALAKDTTYKEKISNVKPKKLIDD